MNDPSISRTAESIVKQFGDQAPAYCAWKIVDTLECGDLTRVKTWLAIRQAVETLLEGEVPHPPVGSCVVGRITRPVRAPPAESSAVEGSTSKRPKH